MLLCCRRMVWLIYFLYLKGHSRFRYLICSCFLIFSYCRLRSSLWLQFKPHHIAAGAAFLAARFLNFDLSYYQNIWHEFKTTPPVLQGMKIWRILSCVILLFFLSIFFFSSLIYELFAMQMLSNNWWNCFRPQHARMCSQCMFKVCYRTTQHQYIGMY